MRKTCVITHYTCSQSTCEMSLFPTTVHNLTERALSTLQIQKRTCFNLKIEINRPIQMVFFSPPRSTRTQEIPKNGFSILLQHCNILQYTATHYNALQHIAIHCNTLQHTASFCNILQDTAPLHGPNSPA